MERPVDKMKILVVSDTHGSNVYLNRAMEEVGEFDYFLHMGDLEGSEHFIEAFVESPYTIISGNNDYFTDIDREKEIDLEGHHIFMTHGNRYNVYAGVDVLKEEAKRRGADIVLFGHTHCPYIEEEDGLVIVNPGSISRPRQPGRIPTYAVMELKKNGQVSVDLHYVKRNSEEN